MLSYAGVLLAATTAEIAVWIAANIKPDQLFPIAGLGWAGDLTSAPILERTLPPWRPVTLDTLFWPHGASRFAQAHFLVTDGQLAQIRRQVTYNQASRPRPLSIGDGVNSITTSMWMLPARPLAQPDLPPQVHDGMYLLTLVDERYWWWDVPFLSIVHDPHTEGAITRWIDLYSRIGTALGLTINVDPIPSAYGVPTVDYSNYYRPLPLQLDAVAFSVGQRIVRRLDGTVTAQNWSTAKANTDSQISLYHRYTGGRMALRVTD